MGSFMHFVIMDFGASIAVAIEQIAGETFFPRIVRQMVREPVGSQPLFVRSRLFLEIDLHVAIFVTYTQGRWGVYAR